MAVKKKKKEPNGVVSNLNMLINKGFCAYTQSRLKNVLKALESQLEPDEYEELKKLYAEIDVENPDAYPVVDGVSYAHEDFAAYVKKLIRKYAKKEKK